jgi:hypothetical protein
MSSIGTTGMKNLCLRLSFETDRLWSNSGGVTKGVADVGGGALSSINPWSHDDEDDNGGGGGKSGPSG